MKWLMLLTLAIFLRIYACNVAVVVWAAKIVPMGAPPIDAWWAFWAMVVLSILRAPYFSPYEEKPKEAMFRYMGLSTFVGYACVTAVWAYFT